MRQFTLAYLLQVQSDDVMDRCVDDSSTSARKRLCVMTTVRPTSRQLTLDDRLSEDINRCSSSHVTTDAAAADTEQSVTDESLRYVDCRDFDAVEHWHSSIRPDIASQCLSCNNLTTKPANSYENRIQQKRCSLPLATNHDPISDQNETTGNEISSDPKLRFERKLIDEIDAGMAQHRYKTFDFASSDNAVKCHSDDNSSAVVNGSPATFISSHT